MSTNLERLLKAAGQEVPQTKPTLEVNPHHPLVRALKHESDDKRFADWSHILFEQAVLAEGGQLDEPGAFGAAQRTDAGTGGDGVEDMDAGELRGCGWRV